MDTPTPTPELRAGPGLITALAGLLAADAPAGRPPAAAAPAAAAPAADDDGAELLIDHDLLLQAARDVQCGRHALQVLAGLLAAAGPLDADECDGLAVLLDGPGSRLALALEALAGIGAELGIAGMPGAYGTGAALGA